MGKVREFVGGAGCWGKVVEQKLAGVSGLNFVIVG